MGLEQLESPNPSIPSSASFTPDLAEDLLPLMPPEHSSSESMPRSGQSPSNTDEEAPLSFSSPEQTPSPPGAGAGAGVNSGCFARVTPPLPPPERPSMSRSSTDPYRPRHQVPQSQLSNLPPQAGPSTHPSRPLRYANPDTHWLSEDEGEAYSSDALRIRSQSRASRAHPSNNDSHSEDGDGKDPDSSKDQAFSTDTSTTHTVHAITHKPAVLAVDSSYAGKDYTVLIPDLSTITPNLLFSLECPTCQNLMQDPVTLLCGHSLCVRCSIPSSLPIHARQAQLRLVDVTDDADIPQSGSLLSPDLETLDPITQMAHRTNHGSPQHSIVPDSETRGSSPARSKLTMSDTACPHSTCRKTTKVQSQGRNGLRTDYVLQKLTLLLRLHVSFASVHEEESMGDLSNSALDADSQDGPGKNSTPGSSPDEISKSEQVGKRGMKSRKKQWGSSKKARSSRSRFSSPNRESVASLPSLITDVLSELECQVCVTLIYEPITTPCGHTFCKRCLFRSLDHSSRCPLCRTELPGFNFFITAPLNYTLHNLLLTTFPRLYSERKDVIEKEDMSSGLDTPIFVCMVAFPNMPTNLHIYEPRYRLMMRRAMDANKRFGMVLPSRSHGGLHQYGTMLEIQNLQTFDDGRSLVETVGVYRFKILESGTLDGYNVGRIERVEDVDDEEEAELEAMAMARGAVRRQTASQTSTDAPVTQEDISATNTPIAQEPAASTPTIVSASEPQISEDPEAAIDTSELTNDQLIGVCKGFVDALREGSTPWLLQRLNNSVPPMPDDPKHFTWWMAMLMPIDDHEKARLLQVSLQLSRCASINLTFYVKINALF